MKTNETLRVSINENIGQIKKENAQYHIDRMTNMTGLQWRMDDSEFMYVHDETDVNMFNPCKLQEGYVWVTCHPVKNDLAKANKKQFKSFDENLFKSYISKFSEEDKKVALLALDSSMNESFIKEIATNFAIKAQDNAKGDVTGWWNFVKMFYPRIHRR